MSVGQSDGVSLRAVVAIPARNEQDRIAACLDALATQVGVPRGSYGIVVFLNNCTDGTEAVVAPFAADGRCRVRVIGETYSDATAGWARRSAMEAAADWLHDEDADDGIILTSDADSRVGPTWIGDNLACIEAGADAVAGQVRLDPAEAAMLPATLHARGLLEDRYETLLTEIGARLDPEPGNPWPCHWTMSGASLAVRRTVYERVGGMPASAIGEDRAFVALLRSDNARVRQEPTIVVTTSARLDGRAPHGVADTIKARCEEQDSFCDGRLEPLHRAIMRVLWRRHLRHLHAGGRLAETGRWSLGLGLSQDDARRCVSHPAFGVAFAAIEALSPRLAFAPLRPSALPAQIALARVAVRLIRVMQRVRRATRRSGSVPSAADAARARTRTNSR